MDNHGCDTNKDPDIRNNVTRFEIASSKTRDYEPKKKESVYESLRNTIPSLLELKQYLGVSICGLLIWATLWFLIPSFVLRGGFLLDMASVVTVGYIVGHTLERYTTLHPVVGMTLVGAVYRTIGGTTFLENATAYEVDFHLRRVYPVIILTKGPLGWSWEYIRSNPGKVFSLATLPWIVECLSLAVCTHLLLEFPWYWGLHIGAILSSVSPAVVVPTCLSLQARGLGTTHQVAQLVANAGGLDTAFTEGVFGVLNSTLFYKSTFTWKIVKGVTAIFAGIVIGIAWGVLLDYIPDHNDPHAPTIKSLLIFIGGLFLSYATAYIGWGGCSGVAIMVCAGTAATRWSRRGWSLNANPVATVYNVLWRIFEPMLFTLTGCFLDVTKMKLNEFGLIICCILLCLLLRLLTAFLVSLASELSPRESFFVAVTWIPKAIVEAVLIRVATDSLWKEGATTLDEKAANQHANIIVIAILITSTLGSALTTALGGLLLSKDTRIAPEEIYRIQTLSPPRSSDLVRRNNTPNSIHCVDI